MKDQIEQTDVTHYFPQDKTVKIVWTAGGQVVSETVCQCPHQVESIETNPCGCRSVVYKSGAKTVGACVKCHPGHFSKGA